MDLPFNPTMPLLGTYLKEPKALIHKNISTPMFIAALFTIARIWKQPKGPSVDEWVKQGWCIYTMEYYSAIKKNGILPSLSSVSLSKRLASKILRPQACLTVGGGLVRPC